MREEYTYRVHSIDLYGNATVEYRHPEYGTLTRYMFLPYDKGDEHIRRKIIENFPRDHFHANRLRNSDAKLPDIIEGKIDMDLDDYFFGVQVMVANASEDS